MLLAVTGSYGYRLAVTAAAFKAKTLCSGVFVAGRAAESIEREELEPAVHPVLQLVSTAVDRATRRVRASAVGLVTREAVYRDGLGCTLAIDVAPQTLAAQRLPLPPPARPDPGRLWPEGERVETARHTPEVDALQLRAAIDQAFLEPDPALPRRTRALVVVHRGRILAERYADGFSAHTPQVGWSMTKSVLNALTGILVRERRLTLDAPAPLPPGTAPTDPRRRITPRHLLHMSSGLAFDEKYADPFSDVVTMLYRHGDGAGFVLGKPLAAEPGQQFHYASGDAMLLARVLRAATGDSEHDYLTLPRRALFDKLGMASAVLETDAAGTFVGAAWAHASARDWARFGLLYLRDGVWNGTRVLPVGWVRFTATPVAVARNYGAQFWLRVPWPYRPADAAAPALPRNAFHAVGHYGQFVSIIPSLDLVVVRLGLARADAWDHEAFLAALLPAFSGKAL